MHEALGSVFSRGREYGEDNATQAKQVRTGFQNNDSD
jgi:hypothetical protein